MARESSAPDRASDPGSDRRRHPRTTADWPLTLRLDDGPREARLRDVSRAGLAFFLDRAIPEMTVLGLDLEFPAEGGPERVRAAGVVVRCERLSEHVDHYEIAVFLHEIEPRTAAAIDAFVRGRAG